MSFNPEYFFPTLITNITQLNGGQFGTVKGTDVYAAVDVTDVTQSPTGTTKPYQVLQLAGFILENFGFDVYMPVLASATSNLVATYNNGLGGIGAILTNSGPQVPFMLDGQAGVLGGRYLINFQTAPAQNGIYILSNVGSNSSNWILTRAMDFNQTSNIIDGGIVYVIYGTSFGNTYWQDTFTPPVTVGTTSIIWSEFSISPAEMVWKAISNTTNASSNQGFITTNGSARVVVNLPATFNIGDTVAIMGSATGGWTMVANTGQNIQFGSLSTVTAGNIESDTTFSNIFVRGLVANTTWTVVSCNSNPTIN